MNQENRFCDYELLPLAVIESAHAGDPSAMDRVLRHYDKYIKKLCTRKLYGDCDLSHYYVDEYMKRHLEIKLITAIVNMKLD
ncbi:helix-turn-helix domain-containing protein [Streptococcus mutans]|uniref:helix-turn-helix domain-containing protein n=1 Tax=Streptococcus mutans TaxID=1309 RepID=UPI001455DAF3|nr:helix-turn-helix domain-containing protein [Streptococcus mutans]NLQ67099.1 helix-turn-helix domain-containing protein [Streptococcus mutans]